MHFLVYSNAMSERELPSANAKSIKQYVRCLWVLWMSRWLGKS